MNTEIFSHPYLHLLRPKQWIKNILVFTPAFFAGALFTPQTLIEAAFAFVAFCGAASAVYIFNDLKDKDEDATHPRKRSRPLAKGNVKTNTALVLLGVSFLVALLSAVMVPAVLFPLFAYVVLNIGYTLFLKQIPVIDVVVVAFFYVLRVVVGGIATDIILSPWIILATFFLALFLVVGKRRGEKLGTQTRTALKSYAPQTLDALLLASAVLSVLAYTMWVVFIHPSSFGVYSVGIVTAVIFKMMNRLYLQPEDGETPETAVFVDPWILVLTVLWGLLMLSLLYL